MQILSLGNIQSTTKRSPPSLSLLDALSPTGSRGAKAVVDPQQAQLDSILKQYNTQGLKYTTTTTPTTPTPTAATTATATTAAKTPANLPYGNSNDAILAAFLKERGIGPSTPKELSLFEQLQAGVMNL